MAGQYQLAVTRQASIGQFGGLTWAYRLTWAAHPDDLQSHVGLILFTCSASRQRSCRLPGHPDGRHVSQRPRGRGHPVPLPNHRSEKRAAAPSLPEPHPLRIRSPWLRSRQPTPIPTTGSPYRSPPVRSRASPAPTQMMRGLPPAPVPRRRPREKYGEPADPGRCACQGNPRVASARDDAHHPGAPASKFARVNSLRLQPGEVEAAQQAPAGTAPLFL